MKYNRLLLFLFRDVIVFSLLFLCLHNSAHAQKKELLVATKEAPPFSMKAGDGTWSGISIALWTEIAGELDLRYRFVETDLQEMLDEVAAAKQGGP